MRVVFLTGLVSLCALATGGAQGQNVRRSAQTTNSSGETLPSSGVQSSNGATTAPVDVGGVVLDARNRSPIARALVRLGNRTVLTDHDGVFHFPEVTATSASFLVSKPGFYSGADGDTVPSRTIRLPATAGIELLLYPEAILTGTIANSAGEGLNGLSVTAQRSAFDENGHHWFPTGQAETDHDGGFRIPVPAGVYAIRVNDHRGRGTTEVVMPMSVPANASSLAEAIHLLPGEEDHLDLRPDVRTSYLVHVSVESEVKGYPMLMARMANGSTLPLRPMPFRDQSDLRIALPRGSYTLKGTMQSQEGLSEAETQVTVTDHEMDGVVLRFTRGANLPLVVEADSTATSDNNAKLPAPAQLGVWLQAVGDAEGGVQMLHVTQQRNATPAFLLPGGVYRLHGQSGGQWYITSATCGGLDLLTQEFPISAALDGTEIRVRVSNNTATLSGKVTLGGEPGAAWVYLLATTPSATPVVIVRANADGSFFRPYLPPGSYRVLALERKINADLQSNATLNRFLDRLQTVTVTPGEQHTLTIDAVPERELSE